MSDTVVSNGPSPARTTDDLATTSSGDRTTPFGGRRRAPVHGDPDARPHDVAGLLPRLHRRRAPDRRSWAHRRRNPSVALDGVRPAGRRPRRVGPPSPATPLRRHGPSRPTACDAPQQGRVMVELLGFRREHVCGLAVSVGARDCASRRITRTATRELVDGHGTRGPASITAGDRYGHLRSYGAQWSTRCLKWLTSSGATGYCPRVTSMRT